MLNVYLCFPEHVVFNSWQPPQHLGRSCSICASDEKRMHDVTKTLNLPLHGPHSEGGEGEVQVRSQARRKKHAISLICG